MNRLDTIEEKVRAGERLDAEDGIALDQTGFPDEMGERIYYRPVARGMEIKLKEKLDALRAAREDARQRRSRTRNVREDTKT